LLAYVLRRLILAVPLALGVATLVYVAIEAAPGDTADVLLGERTVPPEVRERLERAYGLDRGPVERYVRWIGALALRGELGWSHSRSRPVVRVIADALPPTLGLAAAALALHLLAGVALGVFSALRPGGPVDRSLTLVGLVAYALPTFWLGLMAILCLAYFVPLFPASSVESVGADSWSWGRRAADRLWHVALPAAVLGLASSAATLRFVRAGLLRAMGEQFVRAARARGLGRSRLLWLHALRHALLPVINLLGLTLPALLSGSLVVEVVFAWPGMGRVTYDAIRAHDIPLVLGTTLFAAGLVIAGSLLADLAMAIADPRVRLGARGGSR
jgi:peptide/nickel transport system permease protein